jgi:hypothetical protein
MDPELRDRVPQLTDTHTVQTYLNALRTAEDSIREAVRAQDRRIASELRSQGWRNPQPQSSYRDRHWNKDTSPDPRHTFRPNSRLTKRLRPPRSVTTPPPQVRQRALALLNIYRKPSKNRKHPQRWTTVIRPNQDPGKIVDLGIGTTTPSAHDRTTSVSIRSVIVRIVVATTTIPCVVSVRLRPRESTITTTTTRCAIRSTPPTTKITTETSRSSSRHTSRKETLLMTFTGSARRGRITRPTTSLNVESQKQRTTPYAPLRPLRRPRYTIFPLRPGINTAAGRHDSRIPR